MKEAFKCPDSKNDNNILPEFESVNKIMDDMYM